MAEPAVFEAQRDRLWRIAYRMTGSVMDADDAVQETWLRWLAVPDGAADDPRAYLTAVVSRVCHDQFRAAKARRETYPGPWLPEPVVTEPGPEERAELDDSVGLALLAALERLTPAERLALVLHDVFAVPYERVADVLERSPDAARQAAARARRRVRVAAPRRSPDRAAHRAAVDAFLAAVADGDLDALVRVLHPDVVWRSDGGGRVGAARVPVAGAAAVARLAAGIARRFRPGAMSLEIRDVNGVPGLVVTEDGRTVLVLAFAVADDGRVVALDAVVNPEKLAHVRV
ncbi:RNA polymerase sigma factor SigJ [Actinomadura atramentaria]|uniref:RNA polymerase sigma factor SigJ n=1 Tax=Actinomadura atramentaria TaxID=1990 RepID=UPI000361B924|nr:RNA polymerase sigma factor SigJ [Actinomadura atramentaria]